MKKTAPLLLLLILTLAGCQFLYTGLVLIVGPERPPKHNILSKAGEKRVAVVPRSVYINSLELQNAPREIARQIRDILDDPKNSRNKKLRVVEQAKVEAWLDYHGNDFDTFLEVGKDKSIQADIVIGFDIIEFRIRDPLNASLLQGHCKVEVWAIDCETGKSLARETLMIIDPPSTQMPSNPQLASQFRPQFISVVAQQIAALFHHHNPSKLKRIDADNLEMHRIH